jgi:predicted acetyltransferase
VNSAAIAEARLRLKDEPHHGHHRQGLPPEALTCDDDNVGSIRTIEKKAGVLENIITGPDLEKPTRRYRIGSMINGLI